MVIYFSCNFNGSQLENSHSIINSIQLVAYLIQGVKSATLAKLDHFKLNQTQGLAILRYSSLDKWPHRLW